MRTIALFAENWNSNKLSNQLNSQQNSYPKCFSNPKTKGCTQCIQNYQNSRFRQATRTIALFAENWNFNKLSSQLNPHQFPDPNAFSNSKPKGRTRCVQNYQSSRFRQATRTIALFAENQISANYPDNLIPTKLFSNTNFKGVRNASRIRSPRSQKHSKLYFKCVPKSFKLFWSKKRFSDLKSHSETKAT